MIVTYNSIINLFSKLQDNKKAEHYLNELIQKYDAIGDEALRPNTVSFNACLSSFSRAKTQEMAEALDSNMSFTTHEERGKIARVLKQKLQRLSTTDKELP